MANDSFQIGNTYRQVINAWRGYVGDKVRLDSDNGWSERRILFFLLAARSKLLATKKNSKESLSSHNYQTIGCIPLVEVDQNEPMPLITPPKRGKMVLTCICTTMTTKSLSL